MLAKHPKTSQTQSYILLLVNTWKLKWYKLQATNLQDQFTLS